MYAWEGRPFADIARLCARRDPRRYPVGMATAAPREGTPVVLQWFRDPSKLAAFLWRMEPQRWGLRGPTLAEFKMRSEAALVPVPVLGLTEPLRRGYNALSLPHFGVVWWGSWPELTAAADGWPRQVVAAYRQIGENAMPTAVGADEADRFLAYLRAHYLPSESSASGSSSPSSGGA